MPPTPSSHSVKVWDLPTRLFHWALAVLTVLLVATGLSGKLGAHMLAGQAVLALLLFRLAWGFVGSRTSRFSDFVKGPGAALAYVRAAANGHVRSIGHNPLGAYSVLALLAVMLAQAATGLFATDDIFTEGPLAHLVATKTVKLLSTVHRLGLYGVLAFVGLHLAAVAFYRFAKKDDLVEAMISGRKTVPADVSGIVFAGSFKALVLAVLAAALVWGGLALVPPAPAF